LKVPYVYFVRYEDVIADPVNVLQQIVSKYNLRRKSPYLINVLQPTTLNDVRRKKMNGAGVPVFVNKTFDTYRQFYLYGGWQKKFKDTGGLDRLRYIHRYVDKDLMRLWGYEIWNSNENVDNKHTHPLGEMILNTELLNQQNQQKFLGSSNNNNGNEPGRLNLGLDLRSKMKLEQNQIAKEAMAALGVPRNSLTQRAGGDGSFNSNSEIDSNRVSSSSSGGGGGGGSGGTSGIGPIQPPVEDGVLSLSELQFSKCDESNGAIKKRDRKRCSRMKQRQEALASIDKDVNNAKFDALSKYVEEAALSAITI
jgi:uncharacterized membrane protein YgcG